MHHELVGKLRAQLKADAYNARYCNAFFPGAGKVT